MSMQLSSSAKRHSTLFLVIVFVCAAALLGTSIVAKQRAPQTAVEDDTPSPFGSLHGAASVAASVVRIGSRRGSDVHVTRFDDGETTERLAPGMHVILIGDGPGIGREVSLATALEPVGGGSLADIVIYGYQYSSRAALQERSGRFDGVFFASDAALRDASVQEIQARKNKTFVPLSQVHIGPMSRLIVVIQEPGATLTVTEQSGGPLCGNGWIDAPESCDDGNSNTGDGCSRACTIESDFSCRTRTAYRCSDPQQASCSTTGEQSVCRRCAVLGTTLWQEQAFSTPKTPYEFTTNFPEGFFQFPFYDMPDGQRIGYQHEGETTFIGAYRPFTLLPTGTVVWRSDEGKREWGELARAAIDAPWQTANGTPTVLDAKPIAYDEEQKVAYLIASATEAQEQPNGGGFLITEHQWLMTVDTTTMTKRTIAPLPPAANFRLMPGMPSTEFPAGERVMGTFIDRARNTLVHVILTTVGDNASTISIVSRNRDTGSPDALAIRRTDAIPSTLLTATLPAWHDKQFISSVLDQRNGDIYIATRDNTAGAPGMIRIHRIARGDDGTYTYDHSVQIAGGGSQRSFTLAIVGGRLVTVATANSTMTNEKSHITELALPSLTITRSIGMPTHYLKLLPTDQRASGNVLLFHGDDFSYYNIIRSLYGQQIFALGTHDDAPQEIYLTDPKERIDDAFVQADGRILVASSVVVPSYGGTLYYVPIQVRLLTLGAGCPQ